MGIRRRSLSVGTHRLPRRPAVLPDVDPIPQPMEDFLHVHAKHPKFERFNPINDPCEIVIHVCWSCMMVSVSHVAATDPSCD